MENKNTEDGWPTEWNIPGYSDLFPRTARVVRFILRMPHQLSPVSDHFQNTGGGPMIDRELYTVRECPDLLGRDVMMIGPNQMFDNSEEAEA